MEKAVEYVPVKEYGPQSTRLGAKKIERVIEKNWMYRVEPIIYGHQACNPNHSFGPAVRSHYLLHYVLEGEGKLRKGEEVYSVKKGDLFVIAPEETTVYWADADNPWEYCWIGFYLRELPTEDFLRKQAVIRQPAVRHIFTEIKDNYLDRNQDGRLFALTCELLWQLSSFEQKSEKKNNYASYTKTYIENVYMGLVSIQEIADNLHIDRRYLTSLFHKEYGISPQTYLMEFRLKKAKEFLSKGHGVSESAIMAGFSDLTNFSHRYKKYFGVSPKCDKG